MSICYIFLFSPASVSIGSCPCSKLPFFSKLELRPHILSTFRFISLNMSFLLRITKYFLFRRCSGLGGVVGGAAVVMAAGQGRPLMKRIGSAASLLLISTCLLASTVSWGLLGETAAGGPRVECRTLYDCR